MKKIYLHYLSLIAASSMLIVSCGEEHADTGPKYNYERADSLPSGYLEELGIVKTNIEVTAHLYEKMNDNGMSFNESILLSANKSFSGSTKQALGIGAVGSDLVYCASFGQNQSAMSRMKGLMDNANALGIGDAFNEDMLTQLASDDTTINKSVALTKAYINAKDQLFSDERAQLATYMVFGGWLEGLHVGTQMVMNDLSNVEVKLGYWEICNSFESVVHLCEVFKSNSEMVNVGDQIRELGPLLAPIRKNAKKYSTEDVQALATAVEKVRSAIL